MGLDLSWQGRIAGRPILETESNNTAPFYAAFSSTSFVIGVPCLPVLDSLTA